MTKISRWSLGLIGAIALILLTSIVRELLPPGLLRAVIVVLLFAGIYSFSRWIIGSSRNTYIMNHTTNNGTQENTSHTIFSIMLEQVNAIHSVLTQIFNESELSDQDKHEIIMFSAFLSLSTATAGARIAKIKENEIQDAVTAFLDDYSDDTEPLLTLNERIKEYNPLFNIASPTPFVSLSSSLLDHLIVDDHAYLLKIMSWLNISVEPAILKTSLALSGRTHNNVG